MIVWLTAQVGNSSIPCDVSWYSSNGLYKAGLSKLSVT